MQKMCCQKGHLRKHYLRGSVCLQMMGGRFRSVMPSNLVYPGACAIESLPAPGSEYASHAAKGELRRLFARSAPHSLDAVEFSQDRHGG